MNYLNHAARAIFVAALALGLSFSLVAKGASATPPVRISDAWARATVPGQPVGAAYLTLSAASPVTLLQIETDAAKQVQIHDMRTVDGVMQMREQRNLEVAPDRPVVLAPGGMHLMLLDLKKPLKAGETVRLTFTFVDTAQKKIAATIDVPVRPFGK
ncbi:copper chaperone PCu(A)C [Noviherbaspirillum suwonense]|nr:copper chaperone PCu(A)C [Noviherbaspirillum suwonense]